MSIVNTPEQPLVITSVSRNSKIVNKIAQNTTLSISANIKTILSPKPTQITYLAFKVNTPVGDGFQVPYVVIF